MPILTAKLDNLRYLGPVMEVIVVPPKPIIDLLISEGKQIPRLKAMALIDTGASSSCISQQIVDFLNLVPFDEQTVFTAGGESKQFFYDVGVMLPISQPNAHAIQAPCADLSRQPYQLLLGRDILTSCTLFYHGPENSFTIHQ